MARTACVDLPAFPLQLLLKQQPEWVDHPVCVVDRDCPQGKLLWVNEKARAAQILPGMRYGAALALSRDLRAAEMPLSEVERAVRRVTRRLRYFTPFVEPSEQEAGLFWLDASGLERLYPSLRDWGEQVRQSLKEAGFLCSMVVGFSRFGSYALAKSRRGFLLLERACDEQAAARRVPLSRLHLEPKHRDLLARLGVHHVGEFVALPPDGLTQRFDEGLDALHRLARGAFGHPLQPKPAEQPAIEQRQLEHSETNLRRLIAEVELMLAPVLLQLAERNEVLAEIRIKLSFDSRDDHVESIRPAVPTLHNKQIVELIDLRLGALKRLPEGVEEIAICAIGSPATRKQLDLFAEKPRRDLDAANRALARVRAEMGEDAVQTASLREAHLPEGRFRWEKLGALRAASPRDIEICRLIRRVHRKPYPLPPRPRHEPDGWMLRGVMDGPVTRVDGPYVVSGGWWRRAVHREYLFAETQKGELLWVYYDRVRRRWFLQGRVE